MEVLVLLLQPARHCVTTSPEELQIQSFQVDDPIKQVDTLVLSNRVPPLRPPNLQYSGQSRAPSRRHGAASRSEAAYLHPTNAESRGS